MRGYIVLAQRDICLQDGYVYGAVLNTGEARDRLGTMGNIDRQSDQELAAALVIVLYGISHGGLSAADCSVVAERLRRGIAKDRQEDEHRAAADGNLAESQRELRAAAGLTESWRQRALKAGAS